ncbi:uncharacterized protein I206_106107 [Kwoniella pini CBS 10737]|uniref:Mini-chromosome maintenance complex-binding protein n=1 Tax=Kwoniella pini CBS 10737 TaxID=1296096 RepID=A0AAJ8L8H3_9TREE
MLDVHEIIRTACREHDHDIESLIDLEQYIGRLGKSTEPLELVSFRCLLQDTGYPMEVYLPGEHPEGEVDWSKLKERWVGWGVEIPGEQSWVGGDMQSVPGSLPAAVHTKYPLPDRKGDYVYDDVAFRPSSTHHFIGILSSSPLPSNEPEATEVVPTLHVLKIIDEEIEETVEDVREEIVDYLASAFSPPDRLAGEYLLLLLLSSPTARPAAMTPLGTLAINFRRKDESATANFNQIVQSIAPRVVPLPLSIQMLHSHPFLPSSTDSSSLDAGLLQLSEGTVLVVEEDAMGSGGQLNEKAVKNLKALAECITEQRVRYEYPYMEGLKMDSAIKVVVLSQGKTLLPVDIDVIVKGSHENAPIAPGSLQTLRRYLAKVSSRQHAAKLHIPDEIGEVIQEGFVQGRKENAETAEETLKRRMKVARLLALSYTEARLTKEVWQRTLQLDEEVMSRRL